MTTSAQSFSIAGRVVLLVCRTIITILQFEYRRVGGGGCGLVPISRQTNSFGFFEQECVNKKRQHHGGNSATDSSNSLFSISMRSMSHNPNGVGDARRQHGGDGDGRGRKSHEAMNLSNSTALPELFSCGADSPPTHRSVQQGGGAAGGGSGSFYSYSYSSNGFFPANKHASMKMVTEKRMSHLQMKTKRKLCTTGTSGAFNASRLQYVPRL